MAERTSVTQVAQIGVEVTKGTAVAANKRLPSLLFNFGVQASFTEVRSSGNKFPALEVIGKEWSSVKAPTQPITYDEIVYFLSSLFGYAAPVQQGATPAYLWTHALSSSVEDTVKTFTIEQGSAVRAHKAAYCQAMAMTLSGDRDKVDFSADLLARAISDGITLTAAPTTIPQVPVLAKDVTVYVDSDSGDIGTTKLNRLLSWEFSLANKIGPLWVVDKAQSSYVSVVEMPIDASFKMMVEADAEGMAFLPAMRTGDRQFFRVEIESDTEAGTAFPYAITLDMAGEIGDAPSEFSDKDGVYAIEFNFKAVHDATWGKAVEGSVMNTLAAL
jgi:hypothetical protein